MRELLTSTVLIVVMLIICLSHAQANETSAAAQMGLDHQTLPTQTLLEELVYDHGGGLNACGCHFNRKTGECHCHQNRGCGCECQSSSCASAVPGLDEQLRQFTGR